MSTPTLNDATVHDPAFSIIARADRNWCQQACDDPLDDQRIKHLAAAVQQLIDETPAELDRVVKELAAEHWTAEQLRGQVDRIRADYDTLAGERSQLATANTRLTVELDLLRTQYDNLAADLVTAHSDNAELADVLATHVEAVTAALNERDRLLEQLAAAECHRCQWEWDPETGLYYDCDCGRVWPRYELDEGEPVEPELEPLEALMARVREELVGWGRG